MIPGTCPDCGAKRPLPDYLEDVAARQALAELARLVPRPLGELVVEYLGLHAPPGKRVQMRKLARLLHDLAELLTAGTVTRGRETLPAPLAAWERGLQEVLANRDAGSLSVPLSGHGYLCEIVHRQQRTAGARSARATAPTHPSHRPFQPGAVGAGSPALSSDDQAAAQRCDKDQALSNYRSTARLLESASGVAAIALRAQLEAARRRLAALGIEMPIVDSAGEPAPTKPAPTKPDEDAADAQD